MSFKVNAVLIQIEHANSQLIKLYGFDYASTFSDPLKKSEVSLLTFLLVESEVCLKKMFC